MTELTNTETGETVEGLHLGVAVTGCGDFHVMLCIDAATASYALVSSEPVSVPPAMYPLSKWGLK